mmetsp:Transcript_9616/g.26957  ORF Transcript_9616/g.26957 Transcript_9616/m.26957 type:complete len:82 (-) Transcript_9616:834-1079(-)
MYILDVLHCQIRFADVHLKKISTSYNYMSISLLLGRSVSLEFHKLIFLPRVLLSGVRLTATCNDGLANLLMRITVYPPAHD